MKRNKNNIKIPRSFRRFTETPERGRSDFHKLFADRKLKRDLPEKTYIKAANLLATGFSAKRYTGKEKKKKIREAKKVLQQFYDLSTQHGQVKHFRPRKNNRKIYAHELEATDKLKIYPIPVFSDTTEIKIVRRKGEKPSLKLSGKHIEETLFEYPNRKLAAKNTIEETQKLLKKIKRIYGNRTIDMKVMCGNWLSNFHTSKDRPIENQGIIITEIIEEWFAKYPDAKKWLRGIKVTTFKSQEAHNVARQRRKGKYLETKEEHAAKKKRKSKEARKHDKLKGR